MINLKNPKVCYLVLNGAINALAVFMMLHWESLVLEFYPGQNPVWAALVTLTLSNLLGMLLEVPAGVLSDRWGHHRVVQLAFFVLLVSGLSLAVGCFHKPETIVQFCFTFGLSVLSYSLVYTFTSGAFNSWLIEKSSKEALLDLSFQEAFYRSLLWLVLGGTGLLLAPLYTSFALFYALVGISFFVLSLVYVTPLKVEKRGVDSVPSSGNLREALSELFGEWKLLRILITVNIMFGVAYLGAYFWKLPISKSYEVSILGGVFSTEVFLSVFYVVFMGFRLLLLLKPNIFIHKDGVGKFPWVHILLISMSGFIFGLLSFNGGLFVLSLSFFLMQGCVSLSQPRLMGLFHNHVKAAHNRATLESLLSFSLAPVQLLILLSAYFGKINEHIVGVVLMVVSFLSFVLLIGTWMKDLNFSFQKLVTRNRCSSR